MINLIRADLYKLRKLTILKVSVLLITICAIGFAFMSHGMAVGDISSSAGNSASGFCDIFIMSIFGTLLTGILICNDFETKVVHDAVASEHGRRSVVLSKVVTYLIVMIVLLLPYAVVSLICYLSGMAFSEPFVKSVFLDIMANDAVSDVSGVMNVIVVILLTMFSYAAKFSLCIPIAFKVRKPIVVMAIGIAVDYMSQLVVEATKDVQILHDLLNITPFVKGTTAIKLNDTIGNYMEIALVSLVFIILMTIIAHFVFRKSEIK